MSKDYMAAFSRLMSATYLRYKGCLIEKHTSESFVWAATEYPSLDAAKEAIDKALVGMRNNLRK